MMTKQEWLDCNNLNRMLKQVESDRKKQLFALACAKSIQNLDQKSKDLLNKFELFIDGKIDDKELEKAKQIAWSTAFSSAFNAASRAIYWIAAALAHVSPDDIAIRNAVYWAARSASSKEDEEAKQTEFLKDIYNPNLLSLTFPTKAIQLAEEIYESNNLITRLILSDFLEEFHFPEELYAHLKEPTHHKGCWVIDQILGKSND